MEFQLGSLFLKFSRDQQLLLVMPVGDLMVAVKFELFDVAGHKSVGGTAELYEKSDTLVKGKIEGWMRDMDGVQ